jgi:hypothetical protein
MAAGFAPLRRFDPDEPAAARRVREEGGPAHEQPDHVPSAIEDQSDDAASQARGEAADLELAPLRPRGATRARARMCVPLCGSLLCTLIHWQESLWAMNRSASRLR